MKNLGISQKFILFIALAVASFLALTLVISQDLMRRHALRGADELAGAIIDRAERQLGQFFNELESLAVALASMPELREPDPARMRELFLSHVLARKDFLRAIYLGTEDGLMYEWGYGEGFVDHVPTFPPGYDPRKRPWYRVALESGGFSVSPPYLYASIEAIGITCVLPVYGTDGRFVGVLGMDILLDSLAGVLTTLEIPMAGRAMLLDSSGFVIASQFPEFGGPDQSGLRRAELQGLNERIASGRGSFDALVDGYSAHMVYRRMDRPDWTLVIGMPNAAIQEGTAELLRVVTLFDFIMMTLLLLAVAAISGRLVLMPLGDIVKVIAAKEGGDRGARVKIRSGDEFGILGAELNKLFDTADGYSSDLEAKVRERTDELVSLQREVTALRVAEERTRIYRDLHDSIGAKLTNIFFCNGVASSLASEADPRLVDALAGVERNCLEGVQKLREIVHGMRDGQAVAEYSAASLAAGIRRRLQDGGLAFECRIAGRAAYDEAPVEPRRELAAVLEELVSNTLKHAGAQKARLRIDADERRIRVSYADDGRGFSGVPEGRELSGLNNVRYRVEGLGGALSVRGEPGKGASFAVELPLAAPAEGREEGDERVAEARL